MRASVTGLERDTPLAEKTIRFYHQLFGWRVQTKANGAIQPASPHPYCGVIETASGLLGWVPYVEVANLDNSERRALQLGGDMIQKRSQGTVGHYSVFRDPAGVHLALWSGKSQRKKGRHDAHFQFPNL